MGTKLKMKCKHQVELCHEYVESNWNVNRKLNDQ